jgi:hypothetical protein
MAEVDYWPTIKRSPHLRWTSTEFGIINAAAENKETIDSVIESFRKLGNKRSPEAIKIKLSQALTSLKRQKKANHSNLVGVKRSNSIITWDQVESSYTSSSSAPSPSAPNKIIKRTVDQSAVLVTPTATTSTTVPAAATTVPEQIVLLAAELKKIEELIIDEVYKIELRFSWTTKLKKIVNEM